MHRFTSTSWRRDQICEPYIPNKDLPNRSLGAEHTVTSDRHLKAVETFRLLWSSRQRVGYRKHRPRVFVQSVRGASAATACS